MDLDRGGLLEPKPFVAIPCIDGKLESEAVRGLLGFQTLCSAFNIKNEFSFVNGEALISRARNKLVAQFMSSDCTHLFFIDADVGFDGADILKLISRDVDVIAGSYPKKCIPSSYPSSFIIGDNGKFIRNEKHHSLISVEHSGTGFFCIRRNAIEKMISYYPDLKYTNALSREEASRYSEENIKKLNDYTYTLFDTMQRDGLYYGEDNTFCYRWRAIGGEVWVDASANLVHVGRLVYNGSLEEIIKGYEK